MRESGIHMPDEIPGKAAPPSAVSVAMDDLGKEMHTLETVVADLECRLACVLRESGPVGVLQETGKADNKLTVKIKIEAERVSVVTSTLKDILERLEV